jgi:hypothetical protein
LDVENPPNDIGIWTQAAREGSALRGDGNDESLRVPSSATEYTESTESTESTEDTGEKPE